MRTFFPLRSNSNGLMAGSPARAVMRRIKTAALLGDVIIEDGVYRVNAGPGGSSGFWSPGQAEDAHGWQTARERGNAQQSGFVLTIAPTGSDESGRSLMSSEAEISWRSTFLPLKRDLPREFDWIDFIPVRLNSEGTRIAREMRQFDSRSGILGNVSSHFVREKILDHASTDTVAAVALDAAVSMDARHAAVAAAHVRMGQASAVVPAEALAVLVPDVGELGWDDIDRLRQESGWDELRGLWTDIGQIAVDLAHSPREAINLIEDEYIDRLHESCGSSRRATRSDPLGRHRRGPGARNAFDSCWRIDRAWPRDRGRLYGC